LKWFCVALLANDWILLDFVLVLGLAYWFCFGWQWSALMPYSSSFFKRLQFKRNCQLDI
jgi:hypothetical protein